MASAPSTPLVAALITVAAYHNPVFSFNGHVILAALADLIAAWIGLATIYLLLGLSSPEGANANSYLRLKSRLEELTIKVENHHSPSLANGRRSPEETCLKHKLRCTYLTDLRYQLRREGPQWVMGHAYIDAWRQVHRIEEAWIHFALDRDVIEVIDHSNYSIKGSRLRDVTAMQKELEDAKRRLDTRTSPLVGRESESEKSARSDVSNIWRIIHEYRDDRLNQLLNARNYLLLTMGLSGTFAYFLIWLSILAGVDEARLRGAVAIYLVGAIIGLFDRLYKSESTAAIDDDYGFQNAKLRVTPQLSGIAAILGVGLARAISGDTSLTGAYQLSVANLLTAAAMGLTPGIIIKQIKHNYNEQLVAEVRSTKPGHSEHFGSTCEQS